MPRLEPPPLPPSKWMRRGVVIAGSGWVFPPPMSMPKPRRATMPGAKHIDEELITELKEMRQRRGMAPAMNAEATAKGPYS